MANLRKPATSSNKRKLKSDCTTPAKRARRADSDEYTGSSSVHDSDSEPESSQEFPARRILDEKGRKYLVDWEDNPITGAKYKPTWEWKSGVSDGLKADWEARKAAKEAKRLEKANPRRGTRSRPVVPPTTPARNQPSPPVQHSSPATDSSPFIQDSQSPHESPIGSEAYQPSTLDRTAPTASHSTQRVSTAEVSPATTSVVSTTQEAPSLETGKGSVIEEGTDGSASFVPSSNSGPTAESANPTASLQPIEEEESQEIQIPERHTQEEHRERLEIPESPTQEDPPSVDYRPPRFPVLTGWRTFQFPPSLEQISTQESSGINLSEHTLLEASLDVTTSREAVPPENVTKAIQTTEADEEAQPEPSLTSPLQSAAVTPEFPSPEGATENRVERLSVQADSEPSQQGATDQTISSLITQSQGSERNSEPQILEYSRRSLSPPHGNSKGANKDLSPSRQDLSVDWTSQVGSIGASNTNNNYSPKHGPSEHFGAYQEQNAQIVLYSPFVSTQEDSPAQIRQTTEPCEDRDLEECDPATPKSRHDSSQESPPLGKTSSLETYSDIPRPPSYSLDLVDSLPPPRPSTPIMDQSPSTEDMSAEKAAVMAAHAKMLASAGPRKKMKALKKFVRRPRSEDGQSPETPATPAAGPSAPTETRSPSTIPDRSPERAEAPSLRTDALINSAAVHISDTPSLLPDSAAATASAQAQEPSDVPREMTASTDSIIGGSQVSILEDDIPLTANEFIVPLAMHGKQKDEYRHQMRGKHDLLDAFTEEPATVTQVDDIIQLIGSLKAVEMNPDLVFSESDGHGPIRDVRDEDKALLAKHYSEISVKFKFLDTLLRDLREHEIHVMLVLKEENARLMDMLEKFLQGLRLHYHYPAQPRAADFANIQGNIMVTLLVADSSFVLRPPDVIICLDGAGSALDIRKKNWANNPEHAVPILELVIPRAVSHIELCVSPTLPADRRLHTIVASMAQLYQEMGQPIVDTPKPDVSGRLVAEYLIKLEETGIPPEWPLPLIHSIKEVVDYNTQLSQEKFSTHGTSPAQAPMKRPLEDVDEMDLDPVKRTRNISPLGETEVQQQQPSEIIDITHVSDSLPGGSAPSNVNIARSVLPNRPSVEVLQRKLDEALESLARYRELEGIWERRQTEYEDVRKKLSEKNAELQKVNSKLERADETKKMQLERIAKLREELAKRAAELETHQTDNTLSPDEKLAEITHLRSELEKERAAKESAIKGRQQSDSNFEYLKDQLRTAQDAVLAKNSEVESLKAENTKLSTLASGEVAKYKQIHYDASYDALQRQVEKLKLSNAQKDKLLEKQDEEIKRLKGDKPRGYGTRQSSVPRSPRVGAPGSRAASPAAGGGRNRVEHLRKDNA